MEELRTACLDLQTMPHAFETLEQSDLPGIRRRIFAPYVIFYRVGKTNVTLVRIIHGARDYLRILDQD